MKRLLFASTALFAAAGGALAQHETDEIVITSSPLQTSEFEAFQNVDVLDKDQIVENYEGSLGDTLAKLPGVSSTFFGAAAGRPIIRGLGGERVRVLTNGVGSIDAASASPDHAVTTEGLEAESIEVLRGASALAYGGNAISGVVNIIDGTVPSEAPEGGFSGQYYSGYETVNDGWQTAGSVTASAGPLVFTVQGLHREGDDYDIPGFAESSILRAMEEEEHGHEDEDHDDEHDHDDEDHEDHDEHEDEEHVRGVAENTWFEFDSASAGVSLVGERGFIGVAVKGFESSYGIPGHDHAHEHEDEDHDDDHDDEDHEDDHDDHDHDDEEHAHEEEGGAFIEMEQTRIDLRGEYDLHLPWFDLFRFSAATADYEHTEFEPNGEPGTIFFNEGWETRLEVTQAQTERWSGAIGLQAFQQDFRSVGEEAYIPETETTDIGLFTTQRYDAGGWGGEFGARVETREVDSVAGNRDFDTVSASGGLFLRPADGAFLSGNVAFSQRAPGDAELFANGSHLATSQFEVGNPDLDIEEAWTLEAVARLDRDRYGIEASAWYANYNDFIFLAPTDMEEDGLPVFVQTQSDAELHGFEIGADVVVARGAAYELRGDAVIEYVNGELSDGRALPRIPPLSGTIGVEAEFLGPRLTTRAEAELVSEQDETFDFELPTEAYQRVNLSAEWRPVEERDVTLLLQAKNVFDAEGRVHSSYIKDLIPLPGRSFRIAVSAGF